MATAWQKPVLWTLPPVGAKDVRAWLQCRVASGLNLTDVDACHRADVKLLILAGSNPADNYMRAFDKKRQPKGLRLNQVLTLDRKGGNFPAFLEGLFRRVSSGLSIPKAWVELAPQHEGAGHDNLPETIFLAGRGSVALLP